MSALATIFGSLGELSESELKQLYLAIGVRLGIPDVPAGAKPQGPGGRKTSNSKKKGGKASASSTSSKGNPQRKSQWANHPLYQEYSRLKKVVENQSKEAGTSFNAVDTAESRAYRQAFTQWVEAKSSFRAGGEGQQRRSKTEKEEDSEDESEEEEDEEPSSSQKQTRFASPPKPAPGSAGKSSSSPPTASYAGKGKAAAK